MLVEVRGNLKTLFQQYEERKHFSRLSFMSPLDFIEPDIYKNILKLLHRHDVMEQFETDYVCFSVAHAMSFQEESNRMCPSCIAGAVYAGDDSNVFFGGETVFANNTATYGGTSVK